MVMFHRVFVCLPGRVTWINMDQSGANNAIFTTHFFWEWFKYTTYKNGDLAGGWCVYGIVLPT